MSQEQKQSNPKSSLLWNIIDPGDPYDIRKSMIARLPEHTQNFMGGNLEIVCLMQAAEIERLNTYLAEYKLKYLQIERKDLDRHSYEIQIKQLSQKANQASKLRIQNQKLRTFIKNQSIQMQQLMRRPAIPQSLQSQHQQLKKKYQALLNQLQYSRQVTQNHILTITKSTQQIKQLRIKYDRLDKQRLTQLTQQRQKYELKIRQRIQIQIKQIQHKLGLKIYQLQSQCKLNRQQIQIKNHEISTLSNKYQLLKRQMSNKEKQKQKYLSQEMESKIFQLQQINLQLAKKANQVQNMYQEYVRIGDAFQKIQKQYVTIKEENKYLQQQIHRYQVQASQDIHSAQKIEQLQNKLALLSSQIQRLSHMLEYKNQEIVQNQRNLKSTKIQYQAKIRQLTSEYQNKLIIKRQGQQNLNALQTQLNSLKCLSLDLKLKNQLLTKQIVSLSSNAKRIQELQEQLQRSTVIISMRNGQIQNLQAKARMVDGLNADISAQKKALTQKDTYIQNIENQNRNYQAVIRNLQRQVDNKEALKKQLQNEAALNNQLKSGYQSSKNLIAQNQQLINKLRKDLIDLKRVIQQYELDLRKGNLLSRADLDEQVRRKVEQIRVKIQFDYEKQIRRISQQKLFIQRTSSQSNQQVKILQQQLNSLQQKLNRKDRQIIQSISIIQTKYITQIQEMTNSLRLLRQDNEKINGQRNKLKINLSQLQRQLVHQKQQNQITRQLSRKYEQQRIRNDQLQRQNISLKQQIIQIRQRIVIIQNQTQQKSTKIFTIKLQDKQNIISSLQRQLKAARQQMKSLQSTYQNSNTTIKNYRDRLQLVSQQIQRLNKILLNKNNQIDQLLCQQQNFNIILQQKQQQINKYKLSIQHTSIQLRRQIQQNNNYIKQLKNSIQRITYTYEQKLKQENNNYIIKIKQKQQQIIQLHTHIENIEITNKKISGDKERQLERNINQLISINRNLEENNMDKQRIIQEYKNGIIQLRKEIQNLSGEKNNQINIINGLTRQLQTHKRDTGSFQSKIKTQYQNKLIIQITKMQRTHESIKNQVNILRRQIEVRDNQLQNIQNSIYNYQRQIQNLDNVVSQQKRTIIQFKQNTSDKQGLRQRCLQLEANQRTLIERITQTQQHYKKITTQLQFKITQYRQEITRFQQKTWQPQYKDILNRYNQKTAITTKQQQQIKRYETNLHLIAKQCDQYEARFNSLVNQVNNLKRVAVEKENETNHLRMQLANLQQYRRTSEQRQQQFINLRRINEGLAHQNGLLKNRISQLQVTITQINTYKVNIQTQQRKYLELQTQLRNTKVALKQLQQIFPHVAAQRDQLFQVSHQYKAQLDKLRLSLQQKTINQSSYMQLSTKYNQLTTSYNQCRQQIQHYQIATENINKKNLQYEHNLRLTVDQIERMNTLLLQRDNEYNSLNQRYEQLTQQYSFKSEQSKEWEVKYVQLYQSYKKQTQKIAQYQSKIKMLDQQFVKLANMIQALKQQNYKLRTQLSEYNDLIQKNKKLSIQIDRLNIIIVNLKQEVSDIRLKLVDQMDLQKRLDQFLSLLVILFAEIQTLRNRVSQTEKQCQNVRRSSLTPHRVDRQMQATKSIQIKGVKM